MAGNAIIEFDFELNTSGNPKPTTRFRLSPDQFFVNNESLEGIVFECITDRNYMPNTPFLRVIK